MAKMYYESDADMSLLSDKTIGVIGYGSQGHAHALNLKDSGQNVVVGLYEGSKSWTKAEDDGLEVAEVADVAARSDIVMLLAPDHVQSSIYRESIERHMLPGKTLMFGHGFNIHYRAIVAPEEVDVSMVAPKAPGHRMREVFTRGSGVPGLLAVHQDASGDAAQLGLAYARGVGCTRAGVLETTFKEETETDLFGEQAVLCGGVTALMQAGFDTLVAAGYQPEVAYFECLHEMKLIVDLVYEGGFEKMRYSISNTAEYGDYATGPHIITDQTRNEMKRILADIQSGLFAKDFLMENQVGQPRLKTGRRNTEASLLSQVGRRLRRMMPFIGG